ncbi:MAG TPA: glycoside hydrolase family 16 protein [Anaerolineaceae bacterium]|nr:glycoside hydrolase family 16 protein [Anaerolineaceae bacterium]
MLILVIELIVPLPADGRNVVSAMDYSTGPLPSGQRGNWELIFSDDFDGNRLDPDKWVTCYWWDENGCTNKGNRELQWYTPDNITVENGVLRLIARQQQINASDGRVYSYTSGMVTTGRNIDDLTVPTRFSFQYGFAEIRARVPEGKGLWPAFWMLPVGHYSKPEIDVLEFLGHETNLVHLTYHYKNLDGSPGRVTEDYVGPHLPSGWHTFAVNWSPGAITWYVDGVRRAHYEDGPTVSSEPMYLLLNLAVGGNWPGAPDQNTLFPSEYQIDYVRVWKQSGNVSLLPFEERVTDAAGQPQAQELGPQLVVDANPARITSMKFDLRDLTKQDYKQAWLRITTTKDPGAGSPNTQNVYLFSEDEWANFNYNDAVRIFAEKKLAGQLSKTEPNVTYDLELDVTQLQEYEGSIVTLVMVPEGDDGLYFHSGEVASFQPRLVMQTERQKLDVPFYKSWNHALFY